jgi:hypothetical protein
MASRIRTVLSTALVFLLASGLARADQLYQVSGADRYSIGNALDNTDIIYTGSERLHVARRDGGRQYTAVVSYVRTDDAGKAAAHARFVQELEPDGEFVDKVDDDPDFLTILNQPFAIQLDPVTMADLRKLHGSVPFRATSPLGGAELHGTLRSATSGLVGGERSVGVRFRADGPMDGTLPEHPGAVLAGRMHIDGTAYYAIRTDLLVSLDATLTIDGALRGDDHAVPVRITYRRTIAPAAASHGAHELHLQRVRERHRGQIG